jgi:hypothetical protein
MGDMNNSTNGNQDFDNIPDQNMIPANNDIDLGKEIEPEFEQDMEQSSSTQNSDPNSQPYEYNMDTPVKTPKKKVNGGLIAIIIIVAVILTGSILAYANRYSLSNSLALMTKSPSEYYAYIEQKNINSGIDKLTNSYDKYLDLYKKQTKTGVGQDTKINLSVNPELGGLLGLGEIKDFAASIISSSNSEKAKSTIGLSYDGSSLATIETYMDMASNNLYLKVPELSSAYLLFSMNELMAESEVNGDVSYSTLQKDIQDFINNETLSSETLNKILTRYSTIIIKNIDTVEMDKNTKLSASDINSDFTKLTATISNEDANAMALDVLNEAKTDKELINLLTTTEITTETEYQASIDEAINQLNSFIDTTNESESIQMVVYVDKYGQIMGREFNSNQVDTNSSLGYYVTRDGKDLGFTGWIAENDVKTLAFDGTATYSNSKISGKATLTYSEYNELYGDNSNYTFDINFNDVSMSKEKGYMNGQFSLSSSSLMGMEIAVDCIADKTGQQVIFKLLYGGVDAVTFDIVMKETAYQDFEMPAETNEIYDGINELEAYAATMDIESFMANLETTLGVDLDALLGYLLGGSMY